MEKNARYFELRALNGNAFFGFWLIEKDPLDTSESGALDGRKREPGNVDGNGKNPSPGDEPLMTDAQKKYLFRLLADKGIEGDKAYDNLKERLQVGSLKEVTKLEASKMIERLLEENKGGKDAGSPF